jgi:hypothetical protein
MKLRNYRQEVVSSPENDEILSMTVQEFLDTFSKPPTVNMNYLIIKEYYGGSVREFLNDGTRLTKAKSTKILMETIKIVDDL